MYARAPDARWTVRLVRLTDPYRDAFERWLCSVGVPGGGVGHGLWLAREPVEELR